MLLHFSKLVISLSFLLVGLVTALVDKAKPVAKISKIQTTNSGKIAQKAFFGAIARLHRGNPYFCLKYNAMKKPFALLVILFVMNTLSAQDNTFWKRINYFVTKPGPIDTTYIYRPLPGFSLGLFSTGQKAGFDVDVNFKINQENIGSFEGVSSYALTENLCKKVGLEVGYGNVRLGYGLEVGPHSAWKKSAFAFNIIGKSWGVKLNYFNISNFFRSALTVGQEGDDNYFHHEITTDEVALLKSLTIDGYYVFNNKRFAYPAAYKVGLVQRHTAGSWMLTARYMQGSLYNSPEAVWDSYNLIDCFATMQVSVGGGYSVNFVLWHKDPTGPRDEGLRNLTINLTAMPVLTVFNYLKTTSYEYVDSHHSGETVSKILCYPMPNYVGSAALGVNFGRFYFSSQFTYNRFFFRSRDALDLAQMNIPDYVEDLGFRGVFHDWTLKGLLVYRF